MNQQNSKRVSKSEYPTFNTTTTICRISGFPIAQDNYFPNERWAFQTHWIFDRNNNSLITLALDAKTYYQRALCQLAILNRLGCLDLNKPVSLPAKIVHASHSLVLDLFLVWCSKTREQRKILQGSTGLPTYSNRHRSLADNQWLNYESFLEQLYANFKKQNDLEIGDDLAILLDGAQGIGKSGLDASKLGLSQEIVDALNKYRKLRKTRYSPDLAKLVIDSLAEVPANTTLVEQRKDILNFLLNQRYKTVEGFQTCYLAILDANLPEDNFAIANSVKIVMEYLKTQINNLLVEEAGFFGVREFNAKSGRIFHSRNYKQLSEEELQELSEKDLSLLSGDADYTDEELQSIKLRPTKKLQLRMPSKKQPIKLKLGANRGSLDKGR